MARDPELEIHKSWLGFLQPVGLVVSPLALLRAQVVLNRNVVELQQTLHGAVRRPEGDDATAYLHDFPRFAEKVLGWEPQDIAGGPDGPAIPDDLEYNLVEYGETMRPDYAALDQQGETPKWLMLVQMVELGTALDEASSHEDRVGWSASPEAKFERLLREKEIPAGLLCNGVELRLVYAPKGESSGYLTFPVQAMCEVTGREILGAMHMLLSEHRVFSAPDGRRLLDLLAESRKYQNDVSTKLAAQVLGALWELLRGFQAADEAANGRLLGQISREDPNHIYGGLLTTLLRLVFILYAEDKELMPTGPVYSGNYSVSGLFIRLREDAGRYPDTMDQRYGAWAWLLSLFRLLFDGGGHGGLRLPTRNGQLFNPDEHPFLEGRPLGVGRVMGDKIEPPRVSDGCIYRALAGLLILDGERLSYRTLDVEQIGSVYEAMMGFAVERAAGFSIAVKSKGHKPGAVRADPVIDVDELLAQPSGGRKKWLEAQANCDVADKAGIALEKAKTPEDAVAALGKKISQYTPGLLAPGSLYLQPGEERRRSGSHYTPRELTEPIVRTTLRPVLEALGEKPRPEQILDLKVCDPAMGSGAFLVEACRQLAEKLVDAWGVHKCMPALPPDEDPLLHARRLVAERCLYGVDKNPFAVNLAKLSMWLVTLAKNHPFTFVDHAFKHGDSLVGLTRAQIAAFHWKTPEKLDSGPLFEGITKSIDHARTHRDEVHAFGEDDYQGKRDALREADDSLHEARLVGDLIVAAFFGAEKDKVREDLRLAHKNKVDAWKAGAISATELQGIVDDLRTGEKPIPVFHWEVEFSEVFARPNPGFDAIVGNPPFAGKNNLINGNRTGFTDWLKAVHAESHGNADLVAHFYRHAFLLLRASGTFGLIATNTIAQGDSRATGLRWICTHGGEIYAARRRVKWPGPAAVTVSVVHISKGVFPGERMLDDREVSVITAYLFHGGGNENPAVLLENASLCFLGTNVVGEGFKFDDLDKKGDAWPLQVMSDVIAQDPRNAERIFPFIGGEEINDNPTHAFHRYIIDFADMSETEARRWPVLMKLLEQKVFPKRQCEKREAYRRYWWRHGERRVELYRRLAASEVVLACSQTSKYRAFARVPAKMVFSTKAVVVVDGRWITFSLLQSRAHEIWTGFFGSSLEDRPVYTPSDCFETFPFPERWQDDAMLEMAGDAYHQFRSGLMVRNGEGLTDTYNRFHDPDETSPDIRKLREIHAAMDRAVLDAYGWTDIQTTCEFLLDYEEEEDDEPSGKGKRKKKPWRYRWPDEVRDEVLARLLDLNQKRAEEERLAGAGAEKQKEKKPKGGKPKAPKKPRTSQPPKRDSLLLFGEDKDEE